VQIPFNFDIEDIPEDIANIPKLQEQLTEVQSEEMLRYDFQKESGECVLDKGKTKIRKRLQVKLSK
jgi:hypothetical protein